MPTVAVTCVVPEPKFTSLRSTRMLPMASRYFGATWDTVVGLHCVSPMPPRSGTPLRASTEKTVAAATTAMATTATSEVTASQRSGDPSRRPLVTSRTTARARAHRPKKNPKPPTPPSQCGHHGPLENRFDTAMMPMTVPITMVTRLRRRGRLSMKSCTTARPVSSAGMSSHPAT